MAAEAIVYVKLLAHMQAFYQDCFGLAVADSAEDYCVLISAEWTLSLVVVPAAVAATSEVTVPPVRREETPIKIAFSVADIEELRPVIARRGGVLNAATSAWTFRDLVRCDCVDPEGNVVQLLQVPLTQPS